MRLTIGAILVFSILISCGQPTDNDTNDSSKITENPDEYITAGVTKMEAEDYEGAMKAFNKAIELKTENSDAYYYRAIIKLKQGDQSGACEDFEEAVLLGDDEDAYQESLKCLEGREG